MVFTLSPLLIEGVLVSVCVLLPSIKCVSTQIEREHVWSKYMTRERMKRTMQKRPPRSGDEGEAERSKPPWPMAQQPDGQRCDHRRPAHHVPRGTAPPGPSSPRRPVRRLGRSCTAHQAVQFLERVEKMIGHEDFTIDSSQSYTSLTTFSGVCGPFPAGDVRCAATSREARSIAGRPNASTKPA
jgi:hypothetical protein